jgi:hypothetical protein
MSDARVEAVADAVLFEGYSLYPYRPSSIKNRRRFNFGVVAPRAVVERDDQGYNWRTTTECLLKGGAGTRLTVTARFLQLTPRSADVAASVDPWLEARVREVELPEVAMDELSSLPTATRLLFNFDHLEGYIETSAVPIAAGGFRLRLDVANTTPVNSPGSFEHNAILPQAFVSTHSILSVTNGAFVSLLEPPAEWRDAAAACSNVGTYPVLAGEPGRRDVMLSSPIILYDYPEIAAESPGDLFDGAEIDEILTLRILTLTEDEKDEIRRSDVRTRQLLERTETLTSEHMLKLHGVMHGNDRR